jgi:hypothetical protein
MDKYISVSSTKSARGLSPIYPYFLNNHNTSLAAKVRKEKQQHPISSTWVNGWKKREPFPYQPVLFLMVSFCTISTEYPSGSKTKAISLYSPSVSRFLQLAFSSSSRAHAASRSSTETPIVFLRLF